MNPNPKPKKKIIRHKKRSAAWRQIRADVHARDGGCVICGLPGDPHHIIYRSQGGDDSLDNLVELCSTRRHHLAAHELTGWAAGRTKAQVAEYLFGKIKE
jgi:5-methylcytosine-specific restriction endonuclease McrA